MTSNYTIEELLVLVDKKNLRVPHFQRGQRWGPGDVAKLFDSIYRVTRAGRFTCGTGPDPTKHCGCGRAATHHCSRKRAPSGGETPAAISGALLRSRHRTIRLAPTEWPSSHTSTTAGGLQAPRVMAWLHERDLDSALQDRAFKLADRLRN